MHNNFDFSRFWKFTYLLEETIIKMQFSAKYLCKITNVGQVKGKLRGIRKPTSLCQVLVCCVAELLGIRPGEIEIAYEGCLRKVFLNKRESNSFFSLSGSLFMYNSGYFYALLQSQS